MAVKAEPDWEAGLILQLLVAAAVRPAVWMLRARRSYHPSRGEADSLTLRPLRPYVLFGAAQMFFRISGRIGQLREPVTQIDAVAQMSEALLCQSGFGYHRLRARKGNLRKR
jgi:hypothetical protein